MKRRSSDETSSDDFEMVAKKEDTKLLDPSLTKKKMEGGKTPYPKSVFFIVGNEFCERFCYYGMRAILTLYLTDWLGFTDNIATTIFHFFTFMCYFFPVFGAMLADGYIGKYKTILYLSSVYMLGSVVLSLTAFPPPFWLGPMVGLLLISIGTGGIKPCVSAFGGDQFASDQKKQQAQFFSVFYFAINLGSLLSMIVTPAIRGHVSCFGTSCFSLAFAVPAVLMMFALGLFVVGTPMYKRYPPTGNIIGRSIMCAGRAAKKKFSSSSTKREHWLDYADDKYDEKFISDLKQVTRVLVMYLPLPMFWALFDQQGSRWLLQAKQMNGRIGSFVILPDWMPAFNALFIILFIPLVEYVVYPIFAKCNILQRALQRMVVGMLLTALAFVVAAMLQVRIDRMLNVAPLEGQADLRIINAAPCPVIVKSALFMNTLPESHGSDIIHPDKKEYNVTFSPGPTCGLSDSVSLRFGVEAGYVYHVVVAKQGNGLQAGLFSYDFAHGVKEDDVDSGEPGVGHVNMIYAGEAPNAVVKLVNEDEPLLEGQVMQHTFNFTEPLSATPFHRIFPATYTIKTKQGDETNYSVLPNDLTVETNGFYTVIIQPNVSHISQLQMVDYTDVEPQSVHILWQLPQYIIITFGEVLFSISGLQFSYSQAPVTMKSTMQAAWLLTDAFGNLIVVIIAAASFLSSQAAEFLLFAALMVLAAIIFGIMAHFYTYVHVEREYEPCEDSDENTLVRYEGLQNDEEEEVSETSLNEASANEKQQ